MRTNVYIDAFNLYYGCLKGTTFKWLDIEALCRRLLPRNELNRIRYFTALVSARTDDPTAPQRQQAYLRALKTLPLVTVHLGRFISRPTRIAVVAPARGAPRTVEVIRTEEKGSDVNLATYLLVDGFQNDYECAVVISNDSDLIEPIKVVRDVIERSVGVVNPHPARRRSRAMGGNFFRQLRPAVLPSCQFPPTPRDGNGEFRKPETW